MYVGTPLSSTTLANATALSAYYGGNAMRDGDAAFEPAYSLNSLANPYALLRDKQKQLVATYMRMNKGRVPPKNNIAPVPGVI
jgi:hypothetical protein